ncbi:ABC transporter substrate-binding protein [Aliihoeflea sp. PC F10.4]
MSLLKCVSLHAVSLAALGLASLPAMAGKADDTVNMAFMRELESADPYFNTAREGILLSHAVWDSLLYRNVETGEYEGNLATDWEWVDDTTLELDLREGVTFHNGAAFTADDVVHTLNFAIDPANAVRVPSNSNWIERAEKIDDHKVRLVLKAPFPAAEEFLAGPLPIYPKDYYEEVGPQGMALKPVGTGPYRVVELEVGGRFVLERNENYHEGPKPAGKVGRIVIRTLPEVNTQIAELMNGSLDLLWNVPTDQAERLEQTGNFEVTSGPAMRIGYLTFDSTGRAVKDGPLTDKRVRQAIYHAIDRQAIVDALLKGSAEVIDSLCTPMQFACSQDLPTYAYDPERAKELLAEAGYPDGFSFDIYAYRDRPYLEAIGGYLNAVGIQPRINLVQVGAFSDRRNRGEAESTFMTWASYSIGDASASTGAFFKGSASDEARDPQIIEWLTDADSTTDREKRLNLYHKALTRIVEEAYAVPLFTYNVNYVTTGELKFTPTPDELIRFFDFEWK